MLSLFNNNIPKQWFVYGYLYYFFFLQLHPVLMLIGLIIIGGEGNSFNFVN